MIEINGRYYCEYCFMPINEQQHVAHNCTSGTNANRFPSSLSEGEVLAGNYIIGKVIGKGGFGVTYLCYDIANQCRVAIKEYFPSTFCHRNNGERNMKITGHENEKVVQKGIQRFYDEAKLLSKFSGNPGIVNVKKFFRENCTVYMVMEYLEGMDLRNYLSINGCPSGNLALKFMAQILRSLRVIHAKNIMHRDLSPDNIFICSNGNVKLIDFGASRINDEVDKKSLSVILKPGYAPMEQYQARGNQGPWTDIYALGATLYYMFTLTAPTDAISRYSGEKVDWSDVPTEFTSIIQKMMFPEIQGRCKNVDEVIDVVLMVTGTDLNTIGLGEFRRMSQPQQKYHPQTGKTHVIQSQHVYRPPQKVNKQFNPEPQENNGLKIALIIIGILLGCVAVGSFAIVLVLLLL